MAPFRKYYLSLVFINVAAALVSAYLIVMHFKPELSDICYLSAKWDCDIVNKSIYSEIFGIPVAILGFLAYSAFLAFALRGLKTDQKKLLPAFLAVLTCALAFAFYLTGIETFVLKTYCLFCVVQQILILLESGVALRLYLLTKRHA
ncbi:MAG: vitamin K epoxide reductase family protein [Candidatus Gracilibacteria bacterium]